MIEIGENLAMLILLLSIVLGVSAVLGTLAYSEVVKADCAQTESSK